MYIHVLVKANSREEKIVKKSDDHFVVSVREKAKLNKANKRVLELFRAMNADKNVKIISGHRSPSKIIAVD